MRNLRSGFRFPPRSLRGPAAALAVLLALCCFADATAQDESFYYFGPEADISFHLVNDSVGTGPVVNYLIEPPVLTTADIRWVLIVEAAHEPGSWVPCGFLFRLTDDGAARLRQLVRTHAGRGLAMRSRGQTFNTLPVEEQEDGFLVWGWYPRPTAERWLRHFLGVELLPDQFK